MRGCSGEVNGVSSEMLLAVSSSSSCFVSTELFGEPGPKGIAGRLSKVKVELAMSREVFQYVQ